MGGLGAFYWRILRARRRAAPSGPASPRGDHAEPPWSAGVA
jgi:hypothetical protein